MRYNVRGRDEPEEGTDRDFLHMCPVQRLEGIFVVLANSCRKTKLVRPPRLLSERGLRTAFIGSDSGVLL